MHGMWTVALLAAAAAAANVTAISARDELSFTTRWCAEDGDCQLHGDTAATCSTAGRCSCSSDHESRLVGSVDVRLCFPKTVVVEVLIDFNNAASPPVGSRCSDVGVSAYVRRGVAGVIEEYTGGRVAYWDFGCHPTQNRPYVSAAVAVPSQCYSTGRDVCSTSTASAAPGTAEECQAECAGQADCWSWSYHPRHRTTDGTVSVAVCNLCNNNVTEASTPVTASFATVSDYVVSGPKVCAQRQRRWSAQADRSLALETAKENANLQEHLKRALHDDFHLRTLLGTSAIVAFDTQREAQRTRCHTETPTHSLPDNAAVLFANPAGVCRPGRCDVGFHASPPAACVAVSPSNTGAFGTCVVDGDCTWEAGRPVCHRAQGRCAPRQAVLPEKVRLPSPLERDYCLRDADCQDSGDSKATCDVHPGLGNWCRCSEGFGYPARFVPRCAREGQTPQPVDMGFTVAFDLPCPLQTRQREQIALLVHNVMGGASEEAAGARDVSDVHHLCLAQTRAVLLGRVRVPINTANELGAESKDAAALLKRFKEELDVEWLDFPVTATPPSSVTARGAAVQNDRDGGKYWTLGRKTYPTSVAAGVVNNCVRDGATYTRLDPEGTCHALACAQYYSLQLSSNVLTCKLGEVMTPAPPVVETHTSDDSDLTHAQLAGIIMGTVCGVVVLALLCFGVVRYHQTAQEEQFNKEMAEAVEDEA